MDRRGEGAWRDACLHGLQALGGVDLLARVRGKAIPRAMGPLCRTFLRSGLKPRFGGERRHARPAWLCRDEALMRLGGQCPPGVGGGVSEVVCTGVLRALAPADVVRAQGPEDPSAHRGYTGPDGQGQTAGRERLKSEGVGMTGLTTDEHDGPPAHGRHHHRRDCQPTPLNAVVVRTWPHRDDGPGGHTVLVTQAAVDTRLPPVDDDDRRLLEHGGSNERTQPWSLTHPPQKTARAVRAHVGCTWLLCAWATTYRWPCAPEEMGAAPVGWPRWRRQRLQQTREQGIVVAQDDSGILPLAESSILLGAQRQDHPPGLGPPQEVLAQYRLTSHG